MHAALAPFIVLEPGIGFDSGAARAGRRIRQTETRDAPPRLPTGGSTRSAARSISRWEIR